MTHKVKIIKKYNHTPREVFEVGKEPEVSQGTYDKLLAGGHIVAEKKVAKKVEKSK